MTIQTLFFYSIIGEIILNKEFYNYQFLRLIELFYFTRIIDSFSTVSKSNHQLLFKISCIYDQ